MPFFWVSKTTFFWGLWDLVEDDYEEKPFVAILALGAILDKIKNYAYFP